MRQAHVALHADGRMRRWSSYLGWRATPMAHLPRLLFSSREAGLEKGDGNSMNLRDLLVRYESQILHGDPGQAIICAGVAYDSRRVTCGSLYIAMRGTPRTATFSLPRP
ncbi:hypothetical protein [Nonomuraea sp. NPDC049784]|uniref:hypothetical protein n=1 Tax=Nonomuraea sp. NPDC049784 TaxID=3154361 RepID=UPI0034077315